MRLSTYLEAALKEFEACQKALDDGVENADVDGDREFEDANSRAIVAALMVVAARLDRLQEELHHLERL